MGLFLFRFWPVLIPLLVYVIWLKVVQRRAVKAGQTVPLFREGPWYWIVFATLMMGLFCFLVLGVSVEGNKGVYVPSHMDNGVMVPGSVREEK